MTDYSKSCIYKIACKDASIEDIYIGSTCNFIKRRWNHKTVCNNPNVREYNYYVYRFIRSHGGWQNWDIYIIEQFSCSTKIQKDQVERGWVEQLKPTLNKYVPANFQTGDVWDYKEYTKGYKEQNKEKNKEYQRGYDQKTIHCQYSDREINLHNRARHNKSKKHIANSETSSSEPDTVMDEMKKLYDNNILKLQEILNTFDIEEYDRKYNNTV